MTHNQKLGRLVQCHCEHTCLPNGTHGFQWLLPRTKSKHMLYQQIQKRNQKASKNNSLQDLEESFSSCSILKLSNRSIKKKKSRLCKPFKIPVLLEVELKKKVTLDNSNTVLKEFFVKSSYN